jgi:hypothetical protein
MENTKKKRMPGVLVAFSSHFEFFSIDMKLKCISYQKYFKFKNCIYYLLM